MPFPWKRRAPNFRTAEAFFNDALPQIISRSRLHHDASGMARGPSLSSERLFLLPLQRLRDDCNTRGSTELSLLQRLLHFIRHSVLLRRLHVLFRKWLDRED